MTIFHLSDLHLGKELIPINRGEYGPLTGHDERTWMNFRNHLLNRIQDSKNNYLVIITGDLSKIGEIESYNLAYDLIFENSNSKISSKFGLNIPKDKVIIVPGNHDSYDGSFIRGNNLRTFHNKFLPSIKSFPFVKVFIDKNSTYQIFGFDSTTKKSAITLAKKLGKGLIDQLQIENLDKLMLDTNQKDRETIKIACMHHCPLLIGTKSRVLMMDKSHDVLKMLIKNDFDIVLCGHLHDDFYDVLPLENMMKLLPKKRGIGRLLKSFFKETILNDYEHIQIAGKKAKLFDSIAYKYIKESGKQLLDVNNHKELPSIVAFKGYLHSLPEYKEFKQKFHDFKKRRNLALIMSGSFCQENKKLKNSYLEIIINDKLSDIEVIKHAYRIKTMGIESKKSLLWL